MTPITMIPTMMRMIQSQEPFPCGVTSGAEGFRTGTEDEEDETTTGTEDSAEEEERTMTWSNRQRWEQPSPSKTLRSSHCSPISTRPLPQKANERDVDEERNGAAVCSRPQTEEQPSPSSAFPSSPSSGKTEMPSPQTGRQRDGRPKQAKPDSNWQSEEHPSPLMRLPSSHCSPLSACPFPHTAARELAEEAGALAEDACGDDDEAGATHRQLSQMPRKQKIPESHPSPISRMPLPQS